MYGTHLREGDGKFQGKKGGWPVSKDKFSEKSTELNWNYCLKKSSINWISRRVRGSKTKHLPCKGYINHVFSNNAKCCSLLPFVSH